MVFAYMRERVMRPRVTKEKEYYQSFKGENLYKEQLKNFNKLWKKYQKNIPYYKDLVEENGVPSVINTFEEFRHIPIMNREYAKQYMNSLTDQSRKPYKWVTTGGSTGTPLKYPSWKEETTYYEPSLWYARDFYNIKRSDRMFRLWGHSHVLGSGLSKYKTLLAFKIGHPLIGFKRFSAYDLSHEKLREAGKEILKFRPQYIIGYSKALYLLAKANKDRKKDLHQLNLKAVIGAAEGFEQEQDKAVVSDVFGAPVGLEYASMETKLLAHTHPEGGYKAIWRNNLIECVDEHGNPSSEGRILVTTLYPRAFPLVRYELGDLISGTLKSKESVYFFKQVKGRDNDFLILDGNTPIHSEGVTHAIKLSEKVNAYQIRYTTDKKYTIYITSNEEVHQREIDKIRQRLKQVDERLAKLPIKQTDQLKQTVAGKTRWLMEE